MFFVTIGASEFIVCGVIGMLLLFALNPVRNELLSDDEEELLNTYKELSVQNKKLLKAYLDGLCKR